MSVQQVLADAEDKMKKSLESARHEFTLIRTGRANPSILEHVMVNYYGQDMPLSQVAAVTVPEPRQLLITPWDKGALAAIEKGIMKSDLNLTPNGDGTAIRLNIPPLNEERRKEFIKQLHKKAELGHAAIRNIRHEALHHLKDLNKKKEIGEDEERRGGEKVQKITDQYIVEIDKAAKIKEQELLDI